MANYCSKLSTILLFALLQCFSPLLHAHVDAESHALSGIHQHVTVELYCLDGDQSHCHDAQVLDTQAVAATQTFPKKPSNAIHAGALTFPLSSAQAQTRLAATPPASTAVPRWHFASPPAHAPPYLF
ncbi:MAG: hypothetical protein Q8L89_06985 [Gammaproteobacteria bacterium]|nr:hypothetical protein [Gammaproteobacteria bacterium]